MREVSVFSVLLAAAPGCVYSLPGRTCAVRSIYLNQSIKREPRSTSPNTFTSLKDAYVPSSGMYASFPVPAPRGALPTEDRPHSKGPYDFVRIVYDILHDHQPPDIDLEVWAQVQPLQASKASGLQGGPQVLHAEGGVACRKG